ncbi:MAG: hypothetical protein ABFC78_09705 [Methanoregula sp.]
MTFQVSDYTVTTDASGNPLFVTRSDGASIPSDPRNTDYAAFLEVDTGAHLCKRVVQPTPVPDPTPSDKDRIAALESAVLVLTGV